MKFTIPEIISKATSILEKRRVAQEQIQPILNDLQKALAAVPEPEPGEPSVAKQFVVLLGPSGDTEDEDRVAWIVQIPEDASVHEINAQIAKVAYAFNATKRGQKFPVATRAEALEAVGAKFFKEQLLWVKTKLPVAALPLRLTGLADEEPPEEKA